MNLRDDFIRSQLFWRLGGSVLIILGIALAVIITPLIFHLPVLIAAVALWGYVSTYHPAFTGKLIAVYIVLSLIYIVYAVVTVIQGDWIIGAIRCLLGAAELTTAFILAKQ